LGFEKKGALNAWGLGFGTFAMPFSLPLFCDPNSVLLNKQRSKPDLLTQFLFAAGVSFFRVRKSFSAAVVLFLPLSSMAALAAASAVMSVALAAPVASSSTFVSKSGSSGLKVSAFQGRNLGVCNGAPRVTMAATEAPSGFTPPQLKADTPSPIFGGNTGGLLKQAQEEEFYVITWDSPKEQIFELPTGMKVSRSSFSSSSFLVFKRYSLRGN
jgi:hypothetical protein